MSGGFLTAKTWLDDDGRHVWLSHDCKDGQETTMLPYPRWKAVDGKVQPSIMCNDCGLHYFATIGKKPDGEGR